MNYHWNYGDRVLNLPAAALGAGADAVQLQVLLLLADGMTDPAALGEAANLTERTVRDAIAFWESTGILTADGKTEAGSEAAPAAKKKTSAAKEEKAGAPAKKLARPDEIPTYSLTELNEMMERRRSLRSLVDESQQILGKMFNTYEINILFGMVDYLGLNEDYLLLLLAHCAKIGKTGLRTIERYAIALADRGITSADVLEEELRADEERHTLEGKVRAMFGMKTRSLTAKEQRMIGEWIGFGYGEEIIRRAYEITVDRINEPSMKYAAAILDRWHAEGLKTPEEIDRYEEAHRSEKGVDRNLAVGTSSFDTDEFFDAALKRAMNAGAGKKKENEQNG